MNLQNHRTGILRKAGVSIWLDNITRRMLDDGTIKRYIHELNVTGLTSNPTIFDLAITGSDYYDQAISRLRKHGLSDEELFFELAIDDIRRAADLFMHIYQETHGLDGFVSIEVSPLLAYDADITLEAAEYIFQKVGRQNVYIKIPGTSAGLTAIAGAIARGIPVNVTLLFSPEQYMAAAEAWLQGIEQRISKGKSAAVPSVASVFVSRWDKAVAQKVNDEMQNRLGIAVMHQVYHQYQNFLSSERVRRAMNYGAFPQRLLWASTGTKDPNASEIHYVANLIAPFTINTMPENTLVAWAKYGDLTTSMDNFKKEYEDVTDYMGQLGIDIVALGKKLQTEGGASFVKSWEHLMESIRKKSF